MLGEVVRRVDGRAYPRYVREAICESLGMADTWVGMPVDRYRAYGHRIGLMHDTSSGPPHPYPGPSFDSESACAGCNPGERARGPAHDLGRFYEMLLAGGEHAGWRSSLGFADPEHSVVLAAVANGTAPDEIAYRRFHGLAAAPYADLGIRSEFQTR